MTAYLVRLKENAELVGLFVSPGPEDLWDYVDECCDPYACEFVALPPGGLYLHNAGAPTVPTIIADPDTNSMLVRTSPKGTPTGFRAPPSPSSGLASSTVDTENWSGSPLNRVTKSLRAPLLKYDKPDGK